MNQGFFRNLSYSGFQLFLNQVLAFVFFIILSKYLSKDDFGLLNWSLAILLIVFSVLSFGLDQLLIKKIAAGEENAKLVTLFFFHSVISGLVFYAILFCSFIFLPDHYAPLVLLAVGKFFLSLSLPFKSLAGGREKFRMLMWMSLPANFVKACGIIFLFLIDDLNLRNTVFVFIAGDLAEFLVSFIIAKKRSGFSKFEKFDRKNYYALIKESLPQFGTVIFAIAISRFDHVLLGFLSTTSTLAEYSFATRIFELATFPLLIIGPLLLPLVSRMNAKGEEEKLKKLQLLLKFEMILACFTMLVVNICWTPVVDPITSGKYGKVNETTIIFLTMSIPFLYLNNVLWTLNFAKGKLKMILRVFGMSFMINLAGDLLLIPYYGAKGAAIAYLITILFQTFLYIRQTGFAGSGKIFQTLCICFSSALFIIFASRSFFSNSLLLILAGVFAFILLLVFTQQIKKNDFTGIKSKFRF